MEFLNSLSSVELVQLEFFAVAAVLSMVLFSSGFLLGRVSKNRDVKVPMEVLHALAATRFDAPKFAVKANDKDAKEDKIEDEIEKILDHVEHHEKDFKHAKDYTLHELDRVIHDFGATPDLTELHKKVEAAHNIPEIVAALHWYTNRHHH
ncbi:MAG: hypothetical protein K8S25_01345 [Alphaproteobacteria bacterium]|nr:hypothetical protein [Alphaproteobacteria bacterium]